MELIILILFIFFELCFAVYCIRKRSYETEKRNIISIATFFAFFVLALLPVIEWSFRWYFFYIFLFISAVLCTVSLILKKSKPRKPFKKNRAIRNSVLSIILIFITLSPALIFPQHKAIPVSGKYKIASAIFSYTDNNRKETYTNDGKNRRLTVEYWYPDNAQGKYPLVVFSHGSFGIKTSNESLFRELASNGYIVCSIDHTYHSLFTTDTDGKTILINKEFMNEIAKEDAHKNKKQSYDYYQKWMNVRTGDINFVINHILEQPSKGTVDKIFSLVDKDKIGLIGHSLGGSAAYGIGRKRSDIDAVIGLEAPYICDITGVSNNQFIWNETKYPVPVLNVYTDSSWGHLKEWSQYKENADMLNAGTGVYNVYIKGSGHLTITDLALTSPFLSNILSGKKASVDTRYCLGTINKISLEFFNHYLKGYDNINIKSVY